MKRSMIFLIIILLCTVSIAGCSSSKSLIMGTWIPKQVSQVVGKQFELVEYQAWDVTENEFILFTDDPASDGNGKLPDSAVKVPYHWNSKHEIMLDGKPYTVEVDKQHLIVKNSELEIQLDRKS